MSFNQVTATSLTPSRPAPAAPTRKGSDVHNVLASSGYGSSFSVGTSSPSSSSYASTYSGIGGSPNRNSDTPVGAHIVRSGTVSLKEDGIVSFLWRPKWLILKEQTLSIYKNEVSWTPWHLFFCRTVPMRGKSSSRWCYLAIAPQTCARATRERNGACLGREQVASACRQGPFRANGRQCPLARHDNPVPATAPNPSCRHELTHAITELRTTPGPH